MRISFLFAGFSSLSLGEEERYRVSGRENLLDNQASLPASGMQPGS
jgi:hypothetical protein